MSDALVGEHQPGITRLGAIWQTAAVQIVSNSGCPAGHRPDAAEAAKLVLATPSV